MTALIREKGVARIDTRKEEEARLAKEEARFLLRAFIDTPSDIVTLRMAVDAIKHLTTLLLEQ